MTVKTLVDAFVTRVAIRDPNIASDINNMQDALEQLAYATISQAAFANVETLGANKTLTDDSPVIQMLNPNGSYKAVILPVLADTNHPFIVCNTSGSDIILEVVNSSTVRVQLVSYGKTYLFFSDGVQWRALGSKNLRAWSYLVSAINKLPYFTGDGTMALADFTNAGRVVLDDASAAAQVSTMGLQIGAHVQAYSANLTTWAGKTPPSGTVIGTTDTQTMTNKRVTPRTGTVASSATPTINTDNVDFYSITALAVDITSMTTNLSGTPTEAQRLRIAITGTATRAITWGSSFEAGVPLPTTTSGTSRLEVGFIWNTVTSKWRCIGYTTD